MFLKKQGLEKGFCDVNFKQRFTANICLAALQVYCFQYIHLPGLSYQRTYKFLELKLCLGRELAPNRWGGSMVQQIGLWAGRSGFYFWFCHLSYLTMVKSLPISVPLFALPPFCLAVSTEFCGQGLPQYACLQLQHNGIPVSGASSKLP